MDLSDERFDRLIELAYDTLERPESWRELYEEIREAVGAKSIHVLALDKRHGTLSYSDGANLPVQGELAYMQQYRFIDPRLPMILEKPLYEWMHCHEELDDEYVAKSRFYQEFLLPYDRRYLTGCKVVDDSFATVVFVTLRGLAEGPLPSESLAFLNRLMPHFARACRISAKNFVYSTQALVGHTLVNKLRQPVILVSTEGEVIHVNESGNRLLRSTSLLRIESGRLKLPKLQHEELLDRFAVLEARVKSDVYSIEAMAQFESFQIAQPESGGRTERLYSFFTMLLPQRVMGAFGLRPIVMLFFYHPDSAPAVDSSLLYAAFGLTPAECRVASLLAEGLSLKKVAEALGTRHETVRKQLRSIYQKTSTNRQPELIRLLLHLPHNAIQST